MKESVLYISLLLLLFANSCKEDKIEVTKDSSDSIPPIVKITKPKEKEITTDTVSIFIEATDDVGIEKIEVYIDDTLYVTLSERPFEVDWNSKSVSNGEHLLKAIAWDATNTKSISEILFFVKNTEQEVVDEILPEVVFITPTQNEAVKGLYNIQLEATDNVGVSKIELFLNESLIKTLFTSPFSFEWDSEEIDDGVSTFKAVVYDNAGNTTFAEISFSVKNFSENDKVTSSCGLTKVYRNNVKSGSITTIYHETGFGADTLIYLNFQDSSLINYTTFSYDDNGNVIENKVLDKNKIPQTITTIEYWANGNQRFRRVERVTLETIFDHANALQESHFDEMGNIILFKNYSSSNSLSNFHLYTNTYNGELLTKSVRNDQIWSFDAITEYSYNENGKKLETIERDFNNNFKGRRVYFYDENNNLINIENYGATNVISNTQSFLVNTNGVVLKTIETGSDGKVSLEHYREYTCKE